MNFQALSFFIIPSVMLIFLEKESKEKFFDTFCHDSFFKN